MVAPDDKRLSFAVLMRQVPRDLTRAELAAILPLRGPTGSYANRVRGCRIRWLNRHGFTHEGQRILGGR